MSFRIFVFSMLLLRVESSNAISRISTTHSKFQTRSASSATYTAEFQTDSRSVMACLLDCFSCRFAGRREVVDDEKPVTIGR